MFRHQVMVVGRNNRIPQLSGRFIDMMQAAEYGLRNDTSAVLVGRSWRRRRTARRLLTKGSVWPPAIVVSDVVVQEPAKMAFFDDRNVIQAFRQD